MDNSKSGLFILHDLVSTFPYLVTLIAWAGIACGVVFYALSYKHFNDLIRTSVGVKQDEHHLKKAISYTVFGTLLWNLEWFTQIFISSLGFNNGDDYLDYYQGDIFQNTAGMSDVLSYIIWICNMIGFFGFFLSIIKANSAVVNPQPKATSKAIMGFVFSLALLRIKEILYIMSLIFRSDSLATWLGY